MKSRGFVPPSRPESATLWTPRPILQLALLRTITVEPRPTLRAKSSIAWFANARLRRMWKPKRSPLPHRAGGNGDLFGFHILRSLAFANHAIELFARSVGRGSTVIVLNNCSCKMGLGGHKIGRA